MKRKISIFKVGNETIKLTEVKKKEMKLKALVYNSCILTMKNPFLFLGGLYNTLLLQVLQAVVLL